MGIVDALRQQLQAHEDRRRDALDADLAALVFTPDTSDLPRVVRNPLVPLGQGYQIPGRLFSDGKARLVVHPAQHVREDMIDWEDA